MAAAAQDPSRARTFVPEQTLHEFLVEFPEVAQFVIAAHFPADPIVGLPNPGAHTKHLVFGVAAAPALQLVVRSV